MYPLETIGKIAVTGVEIIRELRKSKGGSENQLVDRRIKPTGFFVGRKAEIEGIHDLLERENHVFVEGMGGIGKTELIKKYVDVYKKKYHTVQFLRYGDSLLNTIASGLEFHDFDRQKYEHYSDNQEKNREIFRYKMNLLQKCDKGVLIVVDNYNVASDKNFKEFVSGKYKVIFTSRVEHKSSPRYVINIMQKEDLFQLFNRYYLDSPGFSADEESTIKEIILEVRGHTMVTMLVATSMKKDNVKPQEMLEILKEGLNTELPARFRINKEDLSTADEQTMYQHILTLLDMSEIIENENRKYIMTNMSLVPYSGIDREVFYHWALKDRYPPNKHNKPDWNDLGWLIERRWVEEWVEELPDGEKIIHISLHHSISDVAFYKLRPNGENCRGLVDGFIDFNIYSHSRTYLEQEKAVELMGLACKRLEDCGAEIVGVLLIGFGRTHEILANYPESLEWYQKALDIYEKVLGKEHPYTAVSYNNIASVHHRQGDYSKALELHQKALNIREKVLGTEDPYTAKTYNNIAAAYSKQGNYPKALEWFQKALAIREKVLGTEDPDTSTTYNSIAEVYRVQGDYPKALEWFQKALAIREKVLGPEHPSTATTYNNMASVYSDQGDHADALKLYQKALGVLEKVLGKEHPDTATTYNNIAAVYYSQGDYPKALELYQKALDIFEKALGTEHPHTVMTYISIAFVHDKQKAEQK